MLENPSPPRRHSILTVPIPGWVAEVATAIICLGILVLSMRTALIEGTTTLSHDVLFWIFPWFNYSADVLLHGRFPWWNPFSHGGEPFYPLLAQLRFLDPITIAVVYAGSLFTRDLYILFAWDRLARGLVYCVGAYALLRPIATYPLTRCSLIPVILFSSFLLSSFRQDAFGGHFIWAPFIILVAFKIMSGRDYRWHNWVLLGGLAGLNFQSYFFAGIWILFLLLGTGAALFGREHLRAMWAHPKILLKAGTAALIMILMCLPNLVLLTEQDRFVFPARMLDPETRERPKLGGSQYWEPGANAVTEHALIMPYEHVILTGTASTYLDFIQLVDPFGNRFISSRSWGEASEAFMYFGLWVYAGALWGILAGRHPVKRIWMTVGIGFGLLMLGPQGGLHPLLYPFFPPLWFARHTHAFVLFFSLALLFFYVLGCNRFLDIPPQYDVPLLISGLAGTLLVLAALLASPDRIAALFQSVIDPHVWHSYLIQGRIDLTDTWYIKYRIGPPTIVRLLRLWLLLAGLITLINIRLRTSAGHKSQSGTLCSAALVPTGLWAWDPAFLDYFWEQSAPVLLGFLAAGALIWWMRKLLWPVTVFTAILVIHLVTVTLQVSQPWVFLTFLAIIIGLPASILALPGRAQQGPFRLILPTALVGASLLDLSAFVVNLHGLWDTPRPQTAQFRSAPAEPAWPETRRLSAPSGLTKGPYPQSIRYQEIIARTPVVFSSPIIEETSLKEHPAGDLTEDELTDVLQTGKRWNTFLMPRRYFELITAPLDPSVLRALFAVHQPLLQFKPHALVLPKDNRLQALSSMSPGKAIELLGHTLLLDPDPPAPLPSSAEPADGSRAPLDWRYTIVTYSYDTLGATVSAPAAGYVLWVDGYDRFWTATVDGSEVPVLEANHGFKAVAVAAGSHRIRFRYDPLPYRISVYVFGGGQIAVGLVAGLLWWRGRSRPTGRESSPEPVTSDQPDRRQLPG